MDGRAPLGVEAQTALDKIQRDVETQSAKPRVHDSKAPGNPGPPEGLLTQMFKKCRQAR